MMCVVFSTSLGWRVYAPKCPKMPQKHIQLIQLAMVHWAKALQEQWEPLPVGTWPSARSVGAGGWLKYESSFANNQGFRFDWMERWSFETCFFWVLLFLHCLILTASFFGNGLAPIIIWIWMKIGCYMILYQHAPQKSAGHVGSCAIHGAYMGLFVIAWSTPSPAIFYIIFLTHNVGSLW